MNQAFREGPKCGNMLKELLRMLQSKVGNLERVHQAPCNTVPDRSSTSATLKGIAIQEPDHILDQDCECDPIRCPTILEREEWD